MQTTKKKKWLNTGLNVETETQYILTMGTLRKGKNSSVRGRVFQKIEQGQRKEHTEKHKTSDITHFIGKKKMQSQETKKYGY